MKRKLLAKRNPASHEKPFNLIRWFSVLVLVAIILVAIITSLLLSRFLTVNMLERDAALTMEEVQTIARIEKATDLFKSGTYDRDDRNLQEFFQYVRSMNDVLRANIYSSAGIVIWSTDKTLVGRKYDRNPELEAALGGTLKIESGVIGQEKEPKPEHVNLGRPGDSFVENYIPITDPSSGELIGVVELYRAPRALFATIEQGTRLIWLSAFGAGLFLYLVLLQIVMRADRTMRAQQKRLVEAETLAAVGQLAGAVAHGLRNPLSSIRSSAELALDMPTTEIHETSRDIISEVDRLENMIRQLLLYSQAPSADLEEVDVARLLSEIESTFAREFDKQKVTVSLNVAPDLPPVRADSTLLAHVLNSILANALEAMSGGGQLVLRAAIARRGRAVEVSIEDTGRGIPRAQMADMFKPFRTTKAKGLGMGLALARQIIQRFGGTLRVDSEEGKGTRVTIALRSAT
jgi:signal transduction histidine kinase